MAKYEGKRVVKEERTLDFLVGFVVFLTVLLVVLLLLLLKFAPQLGEKGITFPKKATETAETEITTDVEILPPVEVLEEVKSELLVEVEIEPTEIHLLGVGDNLIHYNVYYQAGKRGEGSSYDFTFTYENVADYIEKADIASINQETMMSKSYAPSTYPLFNSPVDLAEELKTLGFDVVNIANNHMFDKGDTGLKDTIELLTEEHDLVTVGAYINEASYLDIPVITVEGVDFAFIGTTQTTNGLSLSKSSDLIGSVTSKVSEIPAFLEQVERATKVADIVVANIHWGTEYTHTPTEFQETFARQAIEAGVDIIFGHHPHVIQPVEYISRSDGSRGVVCYSLGNFISTQDQRARMIGGMLDVTILVKGEDISLDAVTFLPCITHYGMNISDIQVYPYDSYTAEMASSHGIQYRSSALSHSYIYETVTSVIGDGFLPEDFHTQYGGS